MPTTLWPLFHDRLDLAVFDRDSFERYIAVNQLFAERLAPLLRPNDLVWAGFQTPADLRSFKEYVVQEMRGEKARDDGLVSAYGLTTLAGAFPISIDPPVFRKMAASGAARRCRDMVRASLAGRSLILSVDRLDYSKGLPQRFAAIDEVFGRLPEHCGHVTFMQIASPSRSTVPEYRNIRRQVESAVGRINGRFA